ncbi:homeobox protein knotted-1-like 6 [Prunus yedoensis var. nudiflora]|uniref:Homeobox protein knotted-1-like 6 n=1 Tax=Prunus yedoensis var. nudiflora TaxID=2094558 RepID=A0A314XZZ9_PRUYE|nr:homeobox protein knotted-1-like 6 [Prunus yedoensis var. nudiflora]
MEEMYGLQSTAEYGDKGFQSTAEYEDRALMTPENLILPLDYQSLLVSSGAFRGEHHHHRVPMFGSDDVVLYSAMSEAASPTITPEFQREEDVFGAIKAKIASHPTYPRLIHAYIECQKVGAPPEIASFLDEIRRENDFYNYKQQQQPQRGSCDSNSSMPSTYLGADPELDEFMETYCEMLVKYKSDLSRPFDEATTFLNKIELQLSNLCTSSAHASSIRTLSDEGGASSDEDFSGGEIEVQEAQQRGEDRDLKDRLMRRFGSHIGTLKLEFSKKKKKGKLPKKQGKRCFDWWSVHYKWPYPTEADKIALAESTGLDQRQINNWFINQRKRHWRPSENMQFAVMDNISGPFFTDD